MKKVIFIIMLLLLYVTAAYADKPETIPCGLTSGGEIMFEDVCYISGSSCGYLSSEFSLPATTAVCIRTSARFDIMYRQTHQAVAVYTQLQRRSGPISINVASATTNRTVYGFPGLSIPQRDWYFCFPRYGYNLDESPVTLLEAEEAYRLKSWMQSSGQEREDHFVSAVEKVCLLSYRTK